jgi:hypothetical protein
VVEDVKASPTSRRKAPCERRSFYGVVSSELIRLRAVSPQTANPMLLQLARARQSERHPSDKQRASLFLSGLSLIDCRGLLSGISSVELICSVTVSSVWRGRFSRLCLRCCISQILKGFVLSCSRL